MCRGIERGEEGGWQSDRETEKCQRGRDTERNKNKERGREEERNKGREVERERGRERVMQQLRDVKQGSRK